MGDLSMGEALTGAYRTRPGTPMIGPYSINQMDDFYAALGRGEAKPTGVMNYLQRLVVAQHCFEGARVVDVCCGRGLQLPVLYRYAPYLGSYTGLDITPWYQAEAEQRIMELDEHYCGRPFEIELIECDVARPWPTLEPFDVAVYTSALEHLPRELGIASLRQVAEHLIEGGVLLLSTPNTVGAPQHGVHVYEWHADELVPALESVGLRVLSQIGLLPSEPRELSEGLAQLYGPEAAAWYDRLRELVPAQFLGPVVAAATPAIATEVLYVCARR